MLGATVMPHVIYLHSALVLPRREERDRDEHRHRKMELFDVLLAMNGAWLINSAMVIMAAAVFFGHGLAFIRSKPLIIRWCRCSDDLRAWRLRWRCCASGLSSSTVGTMAGQVILQGFLQVGSAFSLRRVVTMIPAIVVIAMGLDPLKTLVLSQAVLSFCLPFAMIPLLLLTRRRDVMGSACEPAGDQRAGDGDDGDCAGDELLAAVFDRQWESLKLADRFGVKVGLIAIVAALAIVAMVVAMMRSNWQAPPDAIARPNPIPSSDTSIAAGKKIYADRCASCHGDSGDGKGAKRRVMRPSLPISPTLRRFATPPTAKYSGKLPSGIGRCPVSRIG